MLDNHTEISKNKFEDSREDFIYKSKIFYLLLN